MVFYSHESFHPIFRLTELLKRRFFMDTNTIGTTIAKLRRERQIKQEELANFVGVSAQAVSKWENGGMPDTDLLPKIADFFHVSIDTLFARDVTATGSLWNTIFEAIHSVPSEEEMNKAMEICALLVTALGTDDPNESPPELQLEEGTSARILQIQRFSGIARFYQSVHNPYCLILPPFADKEAALFKNTNYPALFRDLGDESFIAAVRFLMNRESLRAFTPNLLIKHLGFNEETAAKVIEKLETYHLIHKEIVEMDDEETVMYKYEFNASFTAMLNFAKELPQPPSNTSNKEEVPGISVNEYVEKRVIID